MQICISLRTTHGDTPIHSQLGSYLQKCFCCLFFFACLFTYMYMYLQKLGNFNLLIMHYFTQAHRERERGGGLNVDSSTVTTWKQRGLQNLTCYRVWRKSGSDSSHSCLGQFQVWWTWSVQWRRQLKNKLLHVVLYVSVGRGALQNVRHSKVINTQQNSGSINRSMGMHK